MVFFGKLVKRRMHSSRMHTAHFLTISSSIQGEDLHLGGGGLPNPPMDADPLWMQTPSGCSRCRPLGCRPPRCRSPRCRPPDADPTRCRPSPQSCDPLMMACWEVNPTVNRMTHRCKNITLLQTLFAGGKYR